MHGISSKAAGGVQNKFRFNGKEQQSQEFADCSGLEWTDYGARKYDNQIGRWHVKDPLAGSYASISPFVYVLNNPIKYVDPTGMKSEFFDNIFEEVFDRFDRMKENEISFFEKKEDGGWET